jgi:hypothetical protein
MRTTRGGRANKLWHVSTSFCAQIYRYEHSMILTEEKRFRLMLSWLGLWNAWRLRSTSMCVFKRFCTVW